MYVELKMKLKQLNLTKSSLIGKIWKDHRKFFVYAFTNKILQTFIPIFEEHSDILCDQIKKELDNGEFDLNSYLKKNSFDVLCSTTFGTDVNNNNMKSSSDKVFEAYVK